LFMPGENDRQVSMPGENDQHSIYNETDHRVKVKSKITTESKNLPNIYTDRRQTPWDHGKDQIRGFAHPHSLPSAEMASRGDHGMRVLSAKTVRHGRRGLAARHR
jgi:hypothetical protein